MSDAPLRHAEPFDPPGEPWVRVSPRLATLRRLLTREGFARHDVVKRLAMPDGIGHGLADQIARRDAPVDFGQAEYGFVRRHGKDYEEILQVAPGITGLTQLVHFLDDLDADNPLAHYEAILPGKISLDVRYVRNHSFLGDLTILLRTLLIPFRLLADEVRVIYDLHRSHPEAAGRLALGGTSFILSIALVVAFLLGGGPPA